MDERSDLAAGGQIACLFCWCLVLHFVRHVHVEEDWYYTHRPVLLFTSHVYSGHSLRYRAGHVIRATNKSTCYILRVLCIDRTVLDIFRRQHHVMPTTIPSLSMRVGCCRFNMPPVTILPDWGRVRRILWSSTNWRFLWDPFSLIVLTVLQAGCEVAFGAVHSHAPDAFVC